MDLSHVQIQRDPEWQNLENNFKSTFGQVLKKAVPKQEETEVIQDVGLAQALKELLDFQKSDGKI